MIGIKTRENGSEIYLYNANDNQKLDVFTRDVFVMKNPMVSPVKDEFRYLTAFWAPLLVRGSKRCK